MLSVDAVCTKPSPRERDVLPDAEYYDTKQTLSSMRCSGLLTLFWREGSAADDCVVVDKVVQASIAAGQKPQGGNGHT